MTLGLAAVSLYYLLGGYRNAVSYGSLEDLGPLVNYQANTEIQATLRNNDGLPGESTTPRPADLLLALSSFFNSRAETGATGDVTIALLDSGGRLIPGFSAGPTAPYLDTATVSQVQTPSESSAPRRCRVDIPARTPLLCVSMPLSQTVRQAFPETDAAAIIVAKPAVALGEVVGDLMPRLLFSGAIGVAAALFLGFLLGQSITAPLRNIARAARSVARGNYSQRVPASGPSETRDLAANFNRMTQEVQRSQQTLRDFLANISHELKTPLTSINGFSEAILDGTIDDTPGVQRSARIINDESNRVLRLVQELLDLSRLEAGQVVLARDDVDLKELFSHVTEVFALRSEDTGVTIGVSVEGQHHVHGDFDRLEQVLNNLLDNAFRHTPHGGSVTISARDAEHGFVQISVSDSGSGIPAEDLPLLFSRFYRSNELGQKRKGYGLGLAIVREIVRAHGGDITATSALGQGTTFTFTLPVDAPVPAPSEAG